MRPFKGDTVEALARAVGVLTDWPATALGESARVIPLHSNRIDVAEPPTGATTTRWDGGGDAPGPA